MKKAHTWYCDDKNNSIGNKVTDNPNDICTMNHWTVSIQMDNRHGSNCFMKFQKKKKTLNFEITIDHDFLASSWDLHKINQRKIKSSCFWLAMAVKFSICTLKIERSLKRIKHYEPRKRKDEFSRTIKPGRPQLKNEKWREFKNLDVDHPSLLTLCISRT